MPELRLAPPRAIALAALALLLHAAPQLWPGAGRAISLAAALPIALAAALCPQRAPWLLAGPALLLGLLSQREMYIFLLLTGATGLILGLTAAHNRVAGLLISTAVTAAGLHLLGPLGGIYPAGGYETAWSQPVTSTVYLLLALAYAWSGRNLFQSLVRHYR